MKNKVRKKPTNKEMTNAIIEINKKVNETHAIVRELDNVIGLYITMKGDLEEFNAFLDKKVKERNDTKTNEKPDKPHLQGNTDSEGRRTEGVRERAK